MQLTDYFDRVRIISLRERRDRRAHISRELARIGTPLEAGKVELFDGIRVSDADGFPSAGYRGCFLSHRAVVKNAAESGARSVLILEDDVVFTPAMLDAGAALLKQLSTRAWGIAFLGYSGTAFSASDESWMPLHANRTGTHCYAVAQDVFPMLLAYMDGVATRPAGHPDGARMGADATYAMFCSRHPQCKAIAANPNLAVQGSSASDLAPRWYDRAPVIRHVARSFRYLALAIKQR